MCQRVSIHEAGLLSFMHSNRRTLSGRFALALPYRHQSCVRARINIKPVLTGFGHGERLIRRIYLVNFSAIKFADVHVQRSLMQLHLHHIVGDIGQGQTGFGTDAHHAGA
jgi:hypothetical protein